uniref:Uncharacterized protein n=1 Tax=Anguilla anguilla TaxID=7936 RepID=A0A0E9UK30_ANGAN
MQYLKSEISQGRWLLHFSKYQRNSLK